MRETEVTAPAAARDVDAAAVAAYQSGLDIGQAALALAKPPREHRRMLASAIRACLLPALAAGAHRGEVPWPRRLRVHKIGEVLSLTWSSASPDGRALFTIGPGPGGDPLLTWLAVGYRDIYL